MRLHWIDNKTTTQKQFRNSELVIMFSRFANHEVPIKFSDSSWIFVYLLALDSLDS